MNIILVVCNLKRFPSKNRNWQLTGFLTYVFNSSKFAVEEVFQRTSNKKELGKCMEVWVSLQRSRCNCFQLVCLWGMVHCKVLWCSMCSGISICCYKVCCLANVLNIFFNPLRWLLLQQKINWSLHYCWTGAMGVLESRD